MVIPLGARHGQELTVLERAPAGPRIVQAVAVRFVPLLGDQGYDERPGPRW
jgi:hypothetical protein